MCINSSCCKRIGFVIVFILLSFVSLCFPTRIAFATNAELEQELNQNIDSILDDIDMDELELETQNVPNLNLSFSDFVKSVLAGNQYLEYNSVISYIKSIFLEYFRTNLRFFVSLFIIAILYEILNTFSGDKFSSDVKSSFKIIFSFLISFSVLLFVKNFYQEIKTLAADLFSFAGILFPILIGLLSLSGSVKSASVFSSFSAFLLESGSFLIEYVLLPLAISILLLSLFCSVFSNGNFSKLTGLFKLCFKYVIIIFFSVFGLLSTVNLVSSAGHDGINLKLTKYAIKNYVPVLGGYVSEGFDFLFSCSVMVKNAIGVCSIIVLVFKILVPVLVIVFFSLGFKVLSVVVGFIGDGAFSDMFDDVSKSFGNFLSVVLGSFLIVFVFVFLIILSVGVV